MGQDVRVSGIGPLGGAKMAGIVGVVAAVAAVACVNLAHGRAACRALCLVTEGHGFSIPSTSRNAIASVTIGLLFCHYGSSHTF